FFVFYFFFFFFSSRRRHTRSDRDWSSDVCSSDLSHEVPLVVLDIWMEEMTGLEVLARLCAISPQTNVIVITGREDSAARITAMRSEERRVGKECRDRWSRDDEKKKEKRSKG